MEHFKKTTKNHPVIMGRKTFESIGKPLSQRLNIVVTRQKSFKANGCYIAFSPYHALIVAQHEDDNIFVIGGDTMFKFFEPYATTIYLTRVHSEVKGDTKFSINLKKWKRVKSSRYPSDSENQFEYEFLVLKRQN